MKVGVRVELADGGLVDGLLTDEHSASSYGLPVLVIDGVPYGPRDQYDGWPISRLLIDADAGEEVFDAAQRAGWVVQGC